MGNVIKKNENKVDNNDSRNKKEYSMKSKFF